MQFQDPRMHVGGVNNMRDGQMERQAKSNLSLIFFKVWGIIFFFISLFCIKLNPPLNEYFCKQ